MGPRPHFEAGKQDNMDIASDLPHLTADVPDSHINMAECREVQNNTR